MIKKYLNILYPVKIEKWQNISGQQLEQIYLGLDSWYETIIDSYLDKIKNKLPKWSWNKSFEKPPGNWCRLFDGDVCDCLRFTYPVCIKLDSRFRGSNIESDCPEWPGLKIGCNYETILTRAYNTNNKSGNFKTDKYTQSGKGFPDDCYFEGLTYPGEYGIPEVCGKELPIELPAYQPGLKYRLNESDSWKELNLPSNESPWWSSPCTDVSKVCQHAGVQLPFLQCINIKTDGSFPKGITDKDSGNYCISKEYIGIKENYDLDLTNYRNNLRNLNFPVIPTTDKCQGIICKNGGKCDPFSGLCICQNNFSGPKCDCQDFPKKPCNLPNNNGYHGLWLYPLRGLGTWRKIGKSIVVNTKLGFLLDNGGYKLEDLAKIVGNTSAGTTNLNIQINRVAQIINKGSVNSDKNYPKWTIDDLKKHGYNGDQERSEIIARQKAIDLVKMWYTDGYSGLGTSNAPQDGFNYDYKKMFPIGTYFSYAASFDNLVLGLLVQMKKDTLQLLIEPQSAQSGLRPAYFFEIFQMVPTKKVNDNYTVFTDLSSTGCKDYFMLNPLDDLDNYLQYGYVSGDKAKDVEIFDPIVMSLSARNITFNN